MPQTNVYIHTPYSGRNDMAIAHTVPGTERQIGGYWNGDHADDPNYTLSITILELQHLFTDVYVSNKAFTFTYNGNAFMGTWTRIPVLARIHNETTGDSLEQQFYVYLYKGPENWWDPDTQGTGSLRIESNDLNIDISGWQQNQIPSENERKVSYTITNIDIYNDIQIIPPTINGQPVFEEGQFYIPLDEAQNDIIYTFELTLSPDIFNINELFGVNAITISLWATTLDGIKSGHINQIIRSNWEDFDYLPSDYGWNTPATQSASSFWMRDEIWDNYFAVDEDRRGTMGPGTWSEDAITKQFNLYYDPLDVTFIPQKGVWLDHCRKYEQAHVFCWIHTYFSVEWQQSQPTDLSDILSTPYYAEHYPIRLEQIHERINAIGSDRYIKFHHTTPDSKYDITDRNWTHVKENIADLFTFHRDFFKIFGVTKVDVSLTGLDWVSAYEEYEKQIYEFSIPFRKAEWHPDIDFFGSLEMKTKYPVTITPNPVLQNTDTILVTISPPLDRYYWECMRAIRGHAFFKCQLYPSHLLVNDEQNDDWSTNGPVYYFDWRKNIEELGDLQIPIFIKPERLTALAGTDIRIKISLCWINPDDEEDPEELKVISNFWRKVKIGNAVDGYWGTAAPAGENIQPPTWWDSTYAVTGDRTNDYQFRKDMRNALFEVLDSSVRKWVIQYWDQFARLRGELVEDWSPAAFQSSERVRLIDTWATEILYNIESIFNFFGEPQVQSLYSGIYSHLQRFRNELGDLVNNTVSASVDNLNQIQELLITLQRKVDEETILSYEMSLPTVPLNQIKVFLIKGDSDRYWNVTDKLFEIDGQLMIDFDQLKQIINSSNKKNYFKQWYLKIVPTGAEISDYSSTNQKTLSANIQESDINILGASLIDDNSKVYKIVNKNSDGTWILSESIDEDVTDKPLTIIYNYFEPQILELKFSWWHNYIPEDIPIGIELPELDVIEEEVIEEEVIEEQETVERGESPNINKEIF